MKASSLVTLAALSAAVSAHASVLVSFEMDPSTITGSGATRGVTPTAIDAGVTSVGLTKSNLLGTSPVSILNYGGGNPATAWTTSVAQPTINVDTTLANSDYITFTVTPISGSTISLESISFDAAVSSNSTPRSIYLLSSVTGFTSSAVLFSNANTPGGGTLPIRSGGVLGSYSVALSDPAFANISGAVEFRLYLQTGAINQDIDFDNIVLNGTVSTSAVPEPASFAMMAAIGALGVVGSRRRRA